jgi:flagellar biogenesis protein FliO
MKKIFLFTAILLISLTSAEIEERTGIFPGEFFLSWFFPVVLVIVIILFIYWLIKKFRKS